MPNFFDLTIAAVYVAILRDRFVASLSLLEPGLRFDDEAEAFVVRLEGLLGRLFGPTSWTLDLFAEIYQMVDSHWVSDSAPGFESLDEDLHPAAGRHSAICSAWSFASSTPRPVVRVMRRR